MKKFVLIIVVVIVLAACVYFVGSGFMKSSSAYIIDYAISPDGKEMSLDVGVGSSAGYIRKVAVHQQQGGKLYLDCYSAFGGINGSVGAKQHYVVPVSEDTELIALFRDKDSYETVLRKNSSGEWVRNNAGDKTS